MLSEYKSTMPARPHAQLLINASIVIFIWSTRRAVRPSDRRRIAFSANFELAYHPEGGEPVTASAFVGTNPMDESIVSDLRVVRQLFGNPMLCTLLTQRRRYFEGRGDSCRLWPPS
jgi:hypothetical protein